MHPPKWQRIHGCVTCRHVGCPFGRPERELWGITARKFPRAHNEPPSARNNTSPPAPRSRPSRTEYPQPYRFEFFRPYCQPHELRAKLHISEHPHRDAEGQARYPEQSAWISQVIRTQHFAMNHVWHSTWVFEDECDIDRFKDFLLSGDAPT